MTTAYFDCQAGASGNMVLGALLDAGLDKTRLLSELQKLDLPPWELRDVRVRRGLIQARLVDFDIENRGGHHAYAGIDACIAEADLTSCAPGVSVVNIDNGFGAGVQATLIARRAHHVSA